MDIIRANLGHPQTRSHSTQFNTVGFPAFFASFNFVVVPKLFLFRSSIFSDIDSRFFRSTSLRSPATLRFNPPTVPILEYTRFQAKRKLFKLSQTTGKNT